MTYLCHVKGYDLGTESDIKKSPREALENALAFILIPRLFGYSIPMVLNLTRKTMYRKSFVFSTACTATDYACGPRATVSRNLNELQKTALF